MKKIFTLLVMALFTAGMWAQNADYLTKKDFQSEKKKISDGIDAAKRAGIDAKKTATKQMTVVDSLAKAVSSNEKALTLTNDSLQKTAAKFNDLESRVTKSSMSALNLLLVAVIVIAVLFILTLAYILFLKKKSDEKISELSKENQRLSDSMKEEMKKSAEALSLALRDNAAKFTAEMGHYAKKQEALAAELEQRVEKVAKEQEAQKSTLEENIKELISKVNSEKTEHKSLHDKIETEVKGLRSLHIKDVEEIKAKL
ncbi:MAG: hypothetical protein NTW10_14025 [Bacteroidetes bacterium]|nr:hypothetical protein [Bacteroidota bacterium]